MVHVFHIVNRMSFKSTAKPKWSIIYETTSETNQEYVIGPTTGTDQHIMIENI